MLTWDPAVGLQTALRDDTWVNVRGRGRGKSMPTLASAQVRLTVEWSDSSISDPPTQAPVADNELNRSSAPSIELRFVVAGQLSPDLPAPQTPESSDPSHPRPPQVPTEPAVLDGLELKRIRKVAKYCGMKAEMWQEDDTVFFQLCVVTEQVGSATLRASSPLQLPSYPFPPGLMIVCLDDSAVARHSLRNSLQTHVPSATVSTFGKDAADVADFKRMALQLGDILIVDQKIEMAGVNDQVLFLCAALDCIA